MNSKLEFEQVGYCLICDQPSHFTAKNSWFRDHLICTRCVSIPRERALMKVLKDFFPNYKNLMIHESSPGNRGVSVHLENACSGYSSSHFFEDIPQGSIDPKTKIQCENLENLSFEDSTFDLIITQDVMEHVFNPLAAFSEISRVLKPGGAHIFSVPILNKAKPSSRRAKLSSSGEICHIQEPVYHGNPIDSKGSLVTIDWGYEISAIIQQACGMPTLIVQIDDIEKGIRAEYIDIVVSLKPSRDLNFSI